MIANGMIHAEVARPSLMPKLSDVVDGLYHSDKKVDNDIELFYYDDLGISMVKTSGHFDFNYDMLRTKNLEEVAVDSNYQYAINGSYFGEFLRERPLAEVLDPNKNYVIVEGTNSYLNVREEPSAEDYVDVVGVLYDNEVVEQIGGNTEWFEIAMDDGTEGWISKIFSREVDLENDVQKYWEYLHAGFLNFYGSHLFPLKTSEESDQLTNVVRYDTESTITQVLDRESFTPLPEGNTRYLEFQTGPLLYTTGKVQTELMYNSNNGRVKRERTLMVVSPDGRTKYFVTARNLYSYLEVTHILLHLSELIGNEWTIISLDGGSSTEFYSVDYPEYNFHIYKVKPIIIGLK
jgi:hypothetical protein